MTSEGSRDESSFYMDRRTRKENPSIAIVEGRQPRDMDGLANDKDGKTWPDHLELAFVRGIAVLAYGVPGDN